MSYKLPFIAMQSALIKTLSATGIEWFDAGVSITEIEDYYKGQGQFTYGIVGAADADANATKDKIIWSVGLDLEIYSNYKGRKKVTEALEALINLLDSKSGIDALNKALNDGGYTLAKMRIGNLRVNLPVYGDTGIWQSGATNITFDIGQKE